MPYSREEQETTLVFDNVTRTWYVYSTVPKHIRKLAKITNNLTLEYENGRAIAAKGILAEKQVSMRRKRIISEEQKLKAANTFSKVRNDD